MKLVELLNTIKEILKKEPALIADTGVKKEAAALEKALIKMEEAIRPFTEISYADYIELKTALKGRTNKTKLPQTSAAFEKFGILLKSDANNGKISFEKYIIEACKKKTAASIVSELQKRPEDIFKEDLFYMARMSDDAARKYADKKYKDPDLKKFMKAVSVNTGKKSGKYDRQASLQNIVYKLPEVRSRI